MLAQGRAFRFWAMRCGTEPRLDRPLPRPIINLGNVSCQAPSLCGGDMSYEAIDLKYVYEFMPVYSTIDFNNASLASE
jgi:hypothetical protein